MSTEKEKMIAGERYNASDPELVTERLGARMLCQQLAALDINAPSRERAALRAKLFGAETDVYITPPFFSDYGYNISLGTNVYFNFNCVVLDGRAVSIGNNCLVGPAVQIYTASHPLSAADRRMGT